jgi:malonate transporter MadM subunit
MLHMLEKTVLDNPLVSAFAFVGLVIWISNLLGRHLTGGRVAGSAIAVLVGLALAYWGGAITGKTKGLADVAQFGGLALMGGAMMRDFTIVATASEVHVDEAKKAGWLGFLALVLGTILPFIVGVGVAYAYGHRDPVTLTTIAPPRTSSRSPSPLAWSRRSWS